MEKDAERIKLLLKKYNEILLNSMSIALSEDLINLIAVNGEDKDFELLDLIKDKNKFRALVTSEFLRLNSQNTVLNDLKEMKDEPEIKMIRNKNTRSGQRRIDF